MASGIDAVADGRTLSNGSAPAIGLQPLVSESSAASEIK